MEVSELRGGSGVLFAGRRTERNGCQVCEIEHTVTVGTHKFIEIRSETFVCKHCGLMTNLLIKPDRVIAIEDYKTCDHWNEISATHDYVVISGGGASGALDFANTPARRIIICKRCRGLCWGFEGLPPSWRNTCGWHAMKQVLSA